MTVTVPTVTLNNGVRMPQLGFGVFQVPDAETTAAVTAALEAGYRSVDTAAIYGNEGGVGKALAASGIARDELFVTTKLWNADQGYDATLKAFDASLSRLGLDYVDLYLMHWPSRIRNAYVDTWRAMVRLREEGRVRAIGVCNFAIPQLQRLIGETGVVPVLNQVELHPYFQQRALRRFHREAGIATQSWSPLGVWKDGPASPLDDQVVRALAAKHGRTPAQVVLRWHLDNGLLVVSKSARPARIEENFRIGDFALDGEDLARMAALDRADGRLGPDPETAEF